jgi:pentose-5-phosphate-3-epimerase
MTVNPGYGGQAFMSEVLPKIGELRRMQMPAA